MGNLLTNEGYILLLTDSGACCLHIFNTDFHKMGAWQSSPASPAANQNGAPSQFNNNQGDTVLIPVDASKQAEAAFLCEFPFARLQFNICVTVISVVC